MSIKLRAKYKGSDHENDQAGGAQCRSHREMMTILGFEELIGASQIYKSELNHKSEWLHIKAWADNKDVASIILARKKSKHEAISPLSLLFPQTANNPVL